jgi:hypothetical protein
MAFEKFDGPWDDAEFLGCRNLFCGERLILDLFEYQQSSPDEDLKIGSETLSETHTIGLTPTSRIWRLIFERPFAVRMRDPTLRCKAETTSNFPGRCCFSEQSEWIGEFVFDQGLGLFTPTHYVFDLIDSFIEIMGDSSPTVEEVANEVSADES